MNTRNLPLHGIKVLDLTRVLAGPWCTQYLADLGADVIKIEHPSRGDDTRAWAPPYLKDEYGKDTSEAAYYLSANRNKRSVAVDLASERGQRIIIELAKQCDVFIENFKVGGLKKYGLDYNSLKQHNPRLIYCSITGFGQDGPMAHEPGYDFILQGMAGFMSITGERDGLPGAGSQKAGVAVIDLFTGMNSVVAILAALHERHHSQLGQYIDMALLDCGVALLANQNMNYLTSGTIPQRAGNAHQNIVPYQVFPTSNGHIIITAGNDGQFKKLADVLGHPEWAEDARYQTNSARLAHRDEIVGLITAITSLKPSEHWLHTLVQAGIPCGPINNLKQVFEDKQVQHRQILKHLKHPLAGQTPSIANPIKFSATPLQYQKAPPTLGQHTQEVLQEFGLEDLLD
ncbi:CaiB/BaiF CoA transferase family protein [Brackiella oedipodis]|uniref:CaiB/BaiF CoA transferase family protein n=1 Tax=Brackiella oedipodis TaxID=124225 RepID=UPI00048C16BD|nr:CaiB/BaiF CoA-transferase family protein [Brackiella oedipodis]